MQISRLWALWRDTTATLGVMRRQNAMHSQHAALPIEWLHRIDRYRAKIRAVSSAQNYIPGGWRYSP